MRSAAAQAFDLLQEAYGAKAIDETIPTLLEALRQPDENSDTALKALREVMNVSVYDVLIALFNLLFSKQSGQSKCCIPDSHSNTYQSANNRI